VEKLAISAKEDSKMKKLHTIILAIMMIFTVTACTQKQTLSSKDPVTLTMWHVYGEQADSPMNRLVDEFNSTVGQEKGIIVTVTNVSSTSKIGAQLLDAQSEKPGSLEMPDLFSAHTTTAMKIGSDYLIDWNDYFSQQELDNFVPEFIEDGTMDGKLTVFPVSKSSYALYINGSKFDQFASETGVNYDMLDTWEGFFDVAEKYYSLLNRVSGSNFGRFFARVFSIGFGKASVVAT
jgi:multiple sugar transport system substrate-binding protein